MKEDASSLQVLKDQVSHITEFIDQNHDRYQDIKALIKKEYHNLSTLYGVDRPLLEKLSDYLNTDPEPWQRFAEMRKAHKEMSKALNKSLEQTKASVASEIKVSYERIQQKAAELKVDVPESFNNFMQTARNVNDLSQLKVLTHEITQKEIDAIKLMQPDERIGEFNSRTFNANKMISNEAGIDQYIQSLRQEMIKLLEQNDKIILK